MESLHTLILIGHIIGTAIGAGGATLSDALFIQSLRDNRIDQSELKLLELASKVVVAGLVILIASGIGFLLTGSPTSERFWAKMTIVAVIAINGFIMHRKLFPIFEQAVKHKTAIDSVEFIRNAPLMLIAGPLSAISWYAAIVLGTWRTLPFNYTEYMMMYGSILTVAIIGAALS